MNALERLKAELLAGGGRKPLRALAASGPLGYGIPEAALTEGLKRKPHFIGCDMGSVDPGPYYLGSGQLATSDAITRSDLTKVLRAARSINVPLLLGTAGTAGAEPHLDTTLSMVRDIARSEGLHFKLASIRADMPRDLLKAAVRAKRVRALGAIAPLTEEEVDGASHIVGQMGIEAFQRALEAGADVVIAGRACDTAVFAAIPAALGYPLGLAMHMAKIIECCSICTTPGGRDALLGTLDVGLSVTPALQPGHSLRLLLDGAPAGLPQQGSLTLEGLSPGPHALQVQVMDSSGEIVQNSGTVTVQMQRTQGRRIGPVRIP